MLHIPSQDGVSYVSTDKTPFALNKLLADISIRFGSVYNKSRRCVTCKNDCLLFELPPMKRKE